MPEKDRPIYKLTFLEQARLGIGLSLLVLLIISFVSYFIIQKLRDESGWVDHSYQVLNNVENMISSLRDAETSQRGFLLTHDSTFLQPYFGSEQKCNTSLNKIKELTRDNAAQQKLIDTLTQLAAIKFRILKQGFTVTNDSSRSDNRKAVLSFGNKIMDQIRVVVSAIEMEESRLLGQRKAVTNHYAYISQIVLSSGLLFAIIIISIAFFVFQSELRQRRNITNQLKSYQAALQDQIKLLNASNLELEQFAYVASHDLQEPLRKITSYSDRITARYKNALDAEAQTYFDRIASAASRMRNLIDDLLSYSKNSRAPNEMKEVDLNHVFKTVMDDLELSIKNQNATITAENLPVVKGEEIQLRQLFQNLISNALKFTNPGATPLIDITSRAISENEWPVNSAKKRSKKYFEIDIKDNGIGFEEKYADKIFVIFQRLHGGNEYDGTGIGLAICKKITENHDGFITVKSQPGNGTTFRVILPS